MQTKYIFVTGGVVSGLGKGIISASLGRLLKARGKCVTIQKFDPYINVDAGIMSPYQHGEVFVTEDGGEADLDLGHYERFIDENLTKNNDVTTGTIYWSIISKERKGEYAGGTVQVIPHVTNAIKERIFRAGKETNANIVIVEIGGTVGDIEGLPYLEAIRQVAQDVGRENVLFIHTTLMVTLDHSGEMKSKPTQQSVKELMSLGIQPDVMVCRTSRVIPEDVREKLSLFCNVGLDCIIQNVDVESLYEIPLMLEDQRLAHVVFSKLKMEYIEPDLSEWRAIIEKEKKIEKSVTIALVGKYVELHDAYLSITEALNHAGIHNDVRVKINWVNAEDLEISDNAAYLGDADAILIPGGFGDRGIEGKIKAVQYARENKIPLFGICMGLHCAVIEFARHVLGYHDAVSAESNKNNSQHVVIDIMPEQKDIDSFGGTMRLGARPCRIAKDSKAYSIYKEELIYERHRTRYEVNNEYRKEFNENGLLITGTSPDDRIVEMIELSDHPWFVCVQFHPEFKSRPNRPHPLFFSFVDAAVNRSK